VSGCVPISDFGKKRNGKLVSHKKPKTAPEIVVSFILGPCVVKLLRKPCQKLDPCAHVEEAMADRLSKLFAFLKENKDSVIILGTCAASLAIGGYSIASGVATVRMRIHETEIRQEVCESTTPQSQPQQLLPINHNSSNNKHSTIVINFN
jgi:hypothetical protein